MRSRELALRWRTLRLGWHVLGAAGASVLGLLLFAKVGEDVFAHESGSFDAAIRAWMLGHRTPFLFQLFTWITNAGSNGPLLSLTLILSAWLWRAKRRYAASGALAAPALSVALFTVIKMFYARARPDGAAHFGIVTFAFPSGHATVSMAAAVAVAFVLWRERLLPGATATAIAIVVPVLVGFSRTYLDVHWATDVLGGWCVGLFVAGLTCAAYEHLRRAPDIPSSPPVSGERNVRRSSSPSTRWVVFLLLAASAADAASLAAQSGRADSTTATTDRRFLRPRELTLLATGLAGSAAISVFDTRIARWDQSSGVQGSSSRRRLVNDITHVNETTLTLAGLAAYGVGRVAHASALTDIAKHVTESVVLTSLASQALRGPLGRTRPYVTHDSDQYDFHAFQGFGSFDNRAWPSLHSATAFAAGSALVGEIRERHPEALSWAAPLIYAAAAMPGLSRMYLDQHWASDVIAGDVIGAVIGGRLVHYAHSSPRGASPGWLVTSIVAPASDGGLMLGLSVLR